MTSNGRHDTARIYQFPIKPRRPDGAVRKTTSVIDRRAHHIPAADFGGSWYHDAAIKTEQAHPHAG